MKKLCIPFIIATALLASCASFRSVDERASPLRSDANVASGVLENGLSWFVARNGEPKNRLFLRLVVRAGSSAEDPDQRGVAHLVEHMAFNGSEHFEKNDLVDYFESVGMSFGPEVNAQTRFDETIYMLEIPSDDPIALEKALLVLRDWACGLTFDQEELDKERGVVIEEWRQGRGAAGRVSDKQFPFLLAGSRYAERLPIGDPEIVKTVSRTRVVDFYKKWYRPELMSAVIVGDADPVMLSRRVETVLGSIPASSDRVKRPIWAVPARKSPASLVIRDPELRVATVRLFAARPEKPVTREADVRANISRAIAVSALQSRLSERSQSAGSPLLAVGASVYSPVRAEALFSLAFVPADGKFAEALSAALEERARFARFGITEGELSRAKSDILDSSRQAWLNRDKRPSSGYADSIVSGLLSGDVVLSAQERFDLYAKIVPELTVKEVSSVSAQWFAEKNNLLVVTAPESAASVPDDAVIDTLWKGWKADALTPYAETGLDRPLFDEPSTRGSVASEEPATADGIKRLVLSNGARVIVYPTEFKDDEILFSAWSKGGTSLASDGDFPSADIAATYARLSGLNGFSASDLDKKLAGKTVSVRPWIDESWEGLSGSSSVADLETLFGLIRARFTAPYFSSDAWASLKSQLETVAASRANDPTEEFSDLENRLLYGDTVRRSNLTPTAVAAMDRNRAEEFYRERFANAGDFTFVFVGSIDESRVRDLAERYLATLPASPTREEAKPLGIEFPSGVKTGETLRGIAPQAQAFLAFGGPIKADASTRDLFGMMNSALEIRLREVIREDMSGSYGVSVSGDITEYPESRYEIRVEFGCDPARVDELTQATLEQIRWLRDAPLDAKYLEKVREAYRRAHEVGVSNNRWWLARIQERDMDGRVLEGISDGGATLNRATGRAIQALAGLCFKTDNYVKATLIPEK